MSESADNESAWLRLKDRFTQYSNGAEARAWLERNWSRVGALFADVTLRDFIFEPIKGVFAVHGTDPANGIRSVITRVAVANAVLAGLPGKMGVGVFVSIGLEAWMAYQIARLVGLDIQKPADIWKYLGLLATSAGVLLFGIKAALGVGFSLFSALIPGINPLIFAELAVTNLVGVLFWVGFAEARQAGSFRVPARLLAKVADETKGLFSFQYGVLRTNLTPANLKKMSLRLWAWLKGDIPVDRPRLRGEVASTVAMAYLLAGRYGELDGPLGQEFLEAIRDRYPDLAAASVEQIADAMRQYDSEQMAGVINMVKGKLFERLVTHYENQDGDAWQAHMHTDESFPGSDLVFRNDDTGDVMEISLKATDNAGYIEEALNRYPDIPILTTEEVGRLFADDPRVSADHISNHELTEITEKNFDALLDTLSPLDVAATAAGGAAASAATSLWPFTVAYLRGRIRPEQLETAYRRVLGESGVALAARVSYGLLFGPIFAWYLLARGVIKLTSAAETSTGTTRRLAARPRSAGPAGSAGLASSSGS